MDSVDAACVAARASAGGGQCLERIVQVRELRVWGPGLRVKGAG